MVPSETPSPVRPLPRLGIGNMSWPGCGFGASPSSREGDDAVADRIVGRAIDAGILLFDTADSYGCGQGEEMLGRALAVAGRRDRVAVVTKVGPVFREEAHGGRECRLDRAWLLQRCERSLARLRTDRIDLYLAHRPDPFTPIEETIGAFEELVARGHIRAYGVSNFPAALLERAADVGSIAATQNAYSLIERDFEHTLRSLCLRREIPLMAYSPLAKGLLAGRYSAELLPVRDDPRWRDWHFRDGVRGRILEAADRLEGVAAKAGVAAATLAIAWCLVRPGVGNVIVGARSEAQVIEAAAAMHHPVPASILRELE